MVVTVGWGPSAGVVTGAIGEHISSLVFAAEPEPEPSFSLARFFSRQWRVRLTREPRELEGPEGVSLGAETRRRCYLLLANPSQNNKEMVILPWNFAATAVLHRS